MLTRYFSDVAGVTTEIVGSLAGMDCAEFSALFPGVKGRPYESGRRLQVGKDAAGRIRPVTRAIKYRPVKDPRICDDRCMSARGPNCECHCGGKNHGAGFAGGHLELFDMEGDAA